MAKGKRVVKVKEPKPVRNDCSKSLGGSDFEAFNLDLLTRVVGCAWIAHEDDTEPAGLSVGLALKAFKPADEIEGMLAAQAVALHHASMECLRRAMLPQQSFEVSSKLRKDGVNAARAMTDMLAALDRKRGKGQQHIRVERVVVNDGGQAIVGDVQGGAPIAPPPRAPMAAIEQDEGAFVTVATGG